MADALALRGDEGRVKLRGAAHKRYIRRFPNGTTHCAEGTVLEREPTP
jgi:hypothetical protein